MVSGDCVLLSSLVQIIVPIEWSKLRRWGKRPSSARGGNTLYLTMGWCTVYVQSTNPRTAEAGLSSRCSLLPPCCPLPAQRNAASKRLLLTPLTSSSGSLSVVHSTAPAPTHIRREKGHARPIKSLASFSIPPLPGPSSRSTRSTPVQGIMRRPLVRRSTSPQKQGNGEQRGGGELAAGTRSMTAGGYHAASQQHQCSRDRAASTGPALHYSATEARERRRGAATGMSAMVLVVTLRLLALVLVLHLADLKTVDAAPPASPSARTGYHFQPPSKFINDPNGPMYYNGWYHLFYQYNPDFPLLGTIVWGHSVSRDLVNWIALKPALVPSIPSDQYGCWSGSTTILHDGTPAIIYTGVVHPGIVHDEVQNIAFLKNKSDPLLREWVKPDYNPIIVPEGNINATLFRDPTTAWYADGHWRMLIGGARNDRGLAFVYRSRDFKHWVLAKHPLHSALTGMWECPDFFPVAGAGHRNGLDTSETGAKYVLKSSLDRDRYDYYTIGKYNKWTDRYVPDHPNGDHQRRRYDYGNFYASKTFYDPVKRRRVLLGWANESDSGHDDKAKGWAGIHAIPRQIWLDQGGKQLMQWPIEELEKLRGKAVNLKGKVVKAGQHIEVTGLESYQADVEATFKVMGLEKAEPLDPKFANDAQKLCGINGADVKGGVGPFGFWVLASANLHERTAVFFRVFKDGSGKHKVLMCNDPGKSSLSSHLYKPTFAGFVDTNISSGEISLRSLIDRSVVESFGARGRTCILSRIYPSIAIGKKARLFVFNSGETKIKVFNLTAWEMKKPLMNGA